MENYFSHRHTTFLDKYKKAKRHANRISLLRGIAFILTVILLAFYFQTSSTFHLFATICLIVGFVTLVLYHRKLESKSQYYLFLTRINEEELKRQNLALSGFDPGDKFINEKHLYTSDLDIFGNNSLFQLVNRCQLDDSKDVLAGWLSQPDNQTEIVQRQQAIQELSKVPDWFQDFLAVLGIEIAKKKKNEPDISQQQIVEWSHAPIEGINRWTLLFITITFNLLFFTTLVLVLFNDLAYQALYVPLFINSLVIAYAVKKLNSLTQGIEKSGYLIKTYLKAICKVENASFSCQKLTDLQAQLGPEANSASNSIKKLARLTHRLTSRANMLYFVLDIPLLLDVYLLLDLYRWKKEHNAEIAAWFQTVNEIESLISLAAFAHASPSFIYPKIIDNTHHFQSKGLGHPLIHEKMKVRNDYQITGSGQVDIITGSNMSGKSTFQRTVGTNIVLALTGAPVDARELTMGTTRVFTSMRTKDNLSESTSSFYAELKRIHQLLEEIPNHTSTFFLLDEILKGTNSEDRHKGAMALAKKLTQKNAFGMISTHDLALSELAKTEEKISNYSFNSTIEGDEIIFDYKLTDGPCRSFNASKLMEKMGIM